MSSSANRSRGVACPAILCLLLLGPAATAAGSPQANQPPATRPATRPAIADVRRLQEQRLETLRQAVAVTQKIIEMGRGSSEEMHRWQRAQLEAELELAETAEQRIELLERGASLASEHEALVLDLSRTGRVPEVAVYAARANRLELEIELARARNNAPDGMEPAAAVLEERREAAAIRQHAEARLRFAAEELANLEMLERAGAPTTPQLLTTMLEASKRVTNARLALATTQEDRLAAAREWRDRASDFVRRVELRAGRDATRVDIAQAKYVLATAEYLLARIEAGHQDRFIP